MSSSRRRSLSRSEKWLVFGAPALLLLLLGGVALQSKLNAEPNLVFPDPIVRPKPNGFDIYVASALAMTFSTPPVDAVNDSQNWVNSNPQLAATYFSLARKTAWLKTNAKAFALFQTAMKTPSLHPDARLNSMAAFKTYGVLRELARKKMIETHAFTLQKRWNGAVNSCLDTVQMSSDIRRGGILMSQLSGAAISAIGRSPLAESNFLPEKLDARESRAAAKRLETILGRLPTFKDALQESRWVTLSEFSRVSKDPNWRVMSKSEVPWQDNLSARFISHHEVVDHINRSFDEAIAEIDKPWSAPRVKYPQVNPLLDMFSAPFGMKTHRAREIVPLNILLLRFALHAYQLENGHFPQSLNELAPGYLKAIPTDTYADGAPFHYRLKAGDYELWSVGPDGKNDDGTPIPWRDGTTGVSKSGRFPSLMPDSTGDYVARQNT